VKENKRNMLVIDDDRAILKVFSRIFEKNGYAVAVAETGKEAEEKIGKQNYDATLVDIRLPDMNGVDLLPIMQEISPKMVKIVMTGQTNADYANRATQNGADAFLSKPVEPNVLLNILQKKLEEKGT
jgi:DNA-binding NtrC family response regulator